MSRYMLSVTHDMADMAASARFFKGLMRAPCPGEYAYEQDVLRALNIPVGLQWVAY